MLWNGCRPQDGSRCLAVPPHGCKTVFVFRLMESEDFFPSRIESFDLQGQVNMQVKIGDTKRLGSSGI